MSKSKIYDIVSNGVIAALYFVLTVINPLSYGEIQLRIAEILCLLCFYKPSFFIGITLGCVLSNVVSKLGFIDIIVGGGATLLSCLFISFISNRLWLSAFSVVLINSFAVGTEISIFMELPYFYSVISIFVSEAIVMSIGYLIFYSLRDRKDFYKMIRANKHLKWKW